MSAYDQRDPTSCDWRRSIHLNPEVESQGDGSCCYAFTICCVLEVLHSIKKRGQLISLSRQDIYNNLINDAEQDKAGRTMVDAIEWVMDNGCMLAELCPYVGRFCPVDYERKVYLKIKTSILIELKKDLLFKKEKDKIYGKQLEEELKISPAAAQIWWTEDLQYFDGEGIYSGPEKEDGFKKAEQHGVTIIGFGEQMKKKKLIKYWIIKNSHSHTWGDKGYAKINRAPRHGRLLIDLAWVLRGIEYENQSDESDED